MKAKDIRPLFWENNQLLLINQTLLPSKYEFYTCSNACDVDYAIKTLIVRGAPAIGCAAAYGIALEAFISKSLSSAEFQQKIHSAFDLLYKSRPTAINLTWALDRISKIYADNNHLSNLSVTSLLLLEAHKILSDDLTANYEIGNHGARLLKSQMTILTHCNAGALATSGHGTALGVIRSAISNGLNIKVIAAETRPVLQGARLTAWELMHDNIDVTLITDNMAAYFMSQGVIDVVIVGADRIVANGDTANKIGTYSLAINAAYHKIPFYVAAPISTFDLSLETGLAIPIEERDALEVMGYHDVCWAPEGVKVLNPAFDVTPAHLITAIITEKGIIHKPNSQNVSDFLRS